MGGRGTFASGNIVAYEYKTINKINGVKVLVPIDERRSHKAPEEAHSSRAYIILNKKTGIFRQYREYNEKGEAIFEIGYHKEPGLGSGEILHVHFYSAPGVENRQKAVRITKTIYEKYKKYLKGVPEPKW